jgi:hypothetical protein
MSFERLSTLETISQSGAVCVIKIDGERLVQGSRNIYTVIISGGRLGEDDFFRLDGDNLDQLISKGVVYYEERLEK